MRAAFGISLEQFVLFGSYPGAAVLVFPNWDVKSESAT
jgi:hypothetical protein